MLCVDSGALVAAGCGWLGVNGENEVADFGFGGFCPTSSEAAPGEWS